MNRRPSQSISTTRALRLHEHVGYHATDESEAARKTEAVDGSRFLYTTKLTEMVEVLRRPRVRHVAKVWSKPTIDPICVRDTI